MNALLEKYGKSFWMLELLSVLFILFFFFVTSYFVVLKSPIAHYKSAIFKNRAQSEKLTLKKNLALSDIQTTAALAQWQKKHPHFLNAVKTGYRPLQLLTRTAQQAGFKIQQVTPLTIKKKNAQGKIVLHRQFQLQLTGQYQDLFYFFQQINNLAWPLNVIKLKISQQGEFNICIEARGFSD